MSTLDFALAQAGHRVRLFERALHDSGPWSFTYCGLDIPASRFIGPDRIVFVGHLPDLCWIHPPTGLLGLVCGDDELAARAIDPPGDGASQIRWELVLPQSVTVG
jgi:hypothetical protein